MHPATDSPTPKPMRHTLLFSGNFLFFLRVLIAIGIVAETVFPKF